MCGIAGVLAGPQWVGHDLEAVARAMADRVVHRGPDDAGTWTDPDAGVAFGHRRLAVVDLSAAGAQPMTSRSGRYVLTYNGELYDAAKLRRRLESEGVSFHGRSDTEVLLEAIAAWGLAVTLERSDGMYAFGLWDRHERVLTLVRDRMGEKPLVYGMVGGALVFASELDALAAAPGFSPTLDRDSVAAFLRAKYVPAPWTIWQGVHKLEPGSMLQVRRQDLDGSLPAPTIWWSVMDELVRGAAKPFGGDDVEAVDELERLIRSAVRSRSIADVPIGTFLSGGVDSSTVTALVQDEMGEQVRTFTVAGGHESVDESSEAQAVASYLGTNHTQVTITWPDLFAALVRLPQISDEPFGDSSQLPTLLVSEAARRDVTVALSGDGGDELFGGYHRHRWVPRIWQRIGRVPSTVRAPAARALAAVPDRAWERASELVPRSRRPRLAAIKGAKLASVLDRDDPAAIYGRLVSHWDDPDSVVIGAREHPTLTHEPSRWPALDLTEQLMAVDAATYLPGDILMKLDRASMAVGLEARVPLLAPDIVAFAASLPLETKVRRGRGKWLLRQVLHRYVPPALVDRPKAGFGVPIGAWLRGPLRPWAAELLEPGRLRRQDLLRPEPVAAAWHEHQSGRRDRSHELWDVLVLQAWLDARGLA